MKIAVVQTNPVFGNKQRNLQSVMELMVQEKADVYVLPELFATGYNFTNRSEVEDGAEEFGRGETFETLGSFAGKTRSVVVYGFAEREGSSLYNSAALVGPDGLKGLYRKIHLFDRETLFFAPGNLPFAVWETPVGRVGVMICFDWYFPESARTLALRGAQLIAHPSNLVLQHCPEAMRTRCLENRVFAATANRIGTETRGGHSLTFIGSSQITSPFGEILHRSSADGVGVGTSEVTLELGLNKSVNDRNNVLKDRRPEFYL